MLYNKGENRGNEENAFSAWPRSFEGKFLVTEYCEDWYGFYGIGKTPHPFKKTRESLESLMILPELEQMDSAKLAAAFKDVPNTPAANPSGETFSFLIKEPVMDFMFTRRAQDGFTQVYANTVGKTTYSYGIKPGERPAPDSPEFWKMVEEIKSGARKDPNFVTPRSNFTQFQNILSRVGFEPRLGNPENMAMIQDFYAQHSVHEMHMVATGMSHHGGLPFDQTFGMMMAYRRIVTPNMGSQNALRAAARHFDINVDQVLAYLRKGKVI